MSGDNCDREFPEGLNQSRLPSFKNLNLRLTKGFGLGGLDVTAYLDARNILNFTNIIQVFTQTNDVKNLDEEENEFAANADEVQNEAVGLRGHRLGRRHRRPDLRRHRRTGGRAAPPGLPRMEWRRPRTASR